MRTSYWGQGRVDGDDEKLRDAVARGVVPPACLWGGEMVRFAEQELKADPCSLCPCPARGRCGGRAFARPTQPAADDPGGVPSGEAGARKLARAGFIRQILRLAGGELEDADARAREDG